MKLFSFFTLSFVLVCGATPCAYADSRPANSMRRDFSSCPGSITSCFASKDSMAYRNMMSDGPEQIVDKYYDQGCLVIIKRFWRPKIQGYVVRTIRNCE
jgi:hypothetical protein